MPIMTRMRDSMPIILFGLLIAFLITIVFDWGMDYYGTRSGKAEVIGTVNGHEITYLRFSEFLRTASENQKQQTGKEPDETTLRQMREQVWQTLVTQQVVEDEIRRLGLNVTDQEIVDWVRGDNPPEDLRQNFVDSTGTFRKDIYDQFLANPNQFLKDPEGSDPNYGTRWLADYEKNLRQRRAQEKLQSVVFASVRVTEGELRARFLDQGRTLDAAYVLFDPVSLVKDEEAALTEEDIRRYYNENLDQYKVTPARTLSYVLFAEQPSPADSQAALEEIRDVATKARGGADFLQLSATYAETADSGAWFRHGELSPDLERAAFGARPGGIAGPVLDARGWQVVKVLEERRSRDEFVHASHILLSWEGGKDSAEVLRRAREIAAQARAGGDFAALARRHSTDQTNAQKGGDLGWFARGRMVKSFEEAAFGVRPGEIAGPVRTQFGMHILKVHARDARELKLSTIRIPVTISGQTRTDVFERARDFSYNAGQTDLAREAASLGLQVREAQVQEKGGVVPGLGVNESAVRWAFRGGMGDVSEPYNFPAGYAVLSVTKVQEEGVRPLEEVMETVRPMALRAKKIERVMQMAAEARRTLASGDSLSALAARRPELRVQRTGFFTTGASVPGIGRDPAFMGAAGALEPGVISRPVQSQRGAFLIQVVTRAAFDSTAYGLQKEGLRAQILQEKRNRLMTEWLEQLKAQADIEDNRDLFFR
ncbi:MAG: peptidylprolyl isomerase [Bacteroidota bacterium]